MRLLELFEDVNSASPLLAKLKNLGHSLPIIRFDEDAEQPTWELDPSNLKPIVILNPEHTELSFEKLSSTELLTYYFDPKYGVFPHEIAEAYVALEILRGRLDDILHKWNCSNFKMGPITREKLAKVGPLSDQQISHMLRTEGHNGQLIDIVGGEAHEIITRNVPDYYDKIAAMDEKII